MKILIIEDEPRAANQLQLLLEKVNFDYEVLAIIDSIEDAVIWFQQNPAPPLVFMDIQLADGLSFEIFSKVDVKSPIIFTTAFDQYAIQAFKVNSIDYLLKPIQEPELHSAIEKLNQRQTEVGINPAMIKQLLSSMQPTKKREGILVKEAGGFIQLKLAELLYVYAEDGLTFGINAQKKRYVIDETIDALYKTLDESRFFKINRGQIVSKNTISKMEPYFNHRVKLNIENPYQQEFIVSRPKTPLFKEWLNS